MSEWHYAPPYPEREKVVEFASMTPHAAKITFAGYVSRYGEIYDLEGRIHYGVYAWREREAPPPLERG